MATPQNVDAVNVNSTTTQKYFNNLYLNIGTVSSNQNDAVIGFFETHTNGNKTAAQALASAVIYTSVAQGMNPMEILTQFTQLPPGQVNAYLTMFLNLNRVGTSYLGLNNQPIVNKYIQRAILV